MHRCFLFLSLLTAIVKWFVAKWQRICAETLACLLSKNTVIVHRELTCCLNTLEAQLKPTHVEGSELLLTHGEICCMKICGHSGLLSPVDFIPWWLSFSLWQKTLNWGYPAPAVPTPSPYPLHHTWRAKMGQSSSASLADGTIPYIARIHMHTRSRVHNGKPVWSSKEPLGCPYKPRPSWLSLSCTDQPCKVLL